MRALIRPASPSRGADVSYGRKSKICFSPLPQNSYDSQGRPRPTRRDRPPRELKELAREHGTVSLIGKKEFSTAGT
jgi:hypothetical protein